MSSTTCPAQEQRALLAELAEVEALDAQLYARRMMLRARMDQLWNPPAPSPQEQFGVLELAGTARIGQTRASSQLINGTRLVEELPGTLSALQAGAMFRESAVLLLELTRDCTPEVVQELERRLLPMMITMNTTELRRVVVALIPEVEADLDPALTEQRLEQARAGRQVWKSDRGQGMTGVHAAIDTLAARRWTVDFEELVRAQKIADDRAGIVRTADQRQADVFAQLPSRFLALLHAIRKGETEQLLALALADPDLADQLEALAQTVPFDDASLDQPPLPDEPAADEPAAEELAAELAEDGVADEAGGEGLWTDLSEGAGPVVWHPELNDEPPPSAAGAPPEPPPDEAREPDPPDAVPHWTDLSLLELAATVIGLPVANPVLLNVHTPMSSLLELDNRSATLDGGGVLPASYARLLLPDAALRRVFTDPDSGIPIGVDPHVIPAPDRSTKTDAGRAAPTTGATGASRGSRQGWGRLEELLRPFTLREQAEPRHDPSRRLRAFIELRDQQCTGIGCSQPASRCHLDHETAYPQGPTAAWNLGAKSARCHRAKHAGWTVTRHGPGPQHGQTTWTSPLGHHYTRLSPWTHPSTMRDPWVVARHLDLDIEIDLSDHAHAA